MDGSIIIADDDKSIRTVLAQVLTRAGCRVRATGTISTLWKWLEDGEGDVLITDVMMPDGDTFDILPVLKRKRPELPVIVISAKNTVMTAIKASETGAYQYLPKPFELSEVLLSVSNALEKGRFAKQSPKDFSDDNQLASNNDDLLPLIGRSKLMQNLYRIIARVIKTDLTVLIEGNSGTGKNLVAKVLHDFGARKKSPFVTINFETTNPDLVEEELLGVESIDEVNRSSRGKFEEAEGGTLFLDEVSKMPVHIQKVILRAIENSEYFKVGAKTPTTANIRFVAATKYDLKGQINEGTFREDLFYRLNVIPIQLPDMKDRLDDINDLVLHFLLECKTEGLGKKIISKDAIDLLMKQDWPGNILELKNFIKRLVVLSDGDNIDSKLVKEELKSRPLTEVQDAAFQNERFSISVESHLKRYFDFHGDSLPPPGLYDRVLKEVELPLIALALSATRGNQLKTADLLGINRNTLRKKIKDLDISVSRGKKMM